MASPKTTPRRPRAASRPAAIAAEPATPLEPVDIESPSLEILESLAMQNALSNLEMRMDSLEIDIARQQGSREDDARRIAGEMAVMKARVEDALAAFAGTADDLREMVRTVEKRMSNDVLAGAPESYRAQLAASIDGVMAGVGDAMEAFATDVRGRVEALAEQMTSVQATMNSVADTVVTLAPMAARLAALESTVARLSTPE